MVTTELNLAYGEQPTLCTYPILHQLIVYLIVSYHDVRHTDNSCVFTFVYLIKFCLRDENSFIRQLINNE